MKTIKDMQKEVENFLDDNGGIYGYHSPMIIAALLKVLYNVSDIFTNFYSYKNISNLECKKSIEKEIGDVLFNVICLANNYGIDLENVLNDVVSDRSKVM